VRNHCSNPGYGFPKSCPSVEERRAALNDFLKSVQDRASRTLTAADFALAFWGYLGDPKSPWLQTRNTALNEAAKGIVQETMGRGTNAYAKCIPEIEEARVKFNNLVMEKREKQRREAMELAEKAQKSQIDEQKRLLEREAEM
jgi:hypothetical protein